MNRFILHLFCYLVMLSTIQQGRIDLKQSSVRTQLCCCYVFLRQKRGFCGLMLCAAVRADHSCILYPHIAFCTVLPLPTYL